MKILDCDIPEHTVFYSWADLARWKLGSRRGFPEDAERFLYCRRTTKNPKWFGEAVMTRFLYYKDFEVWHELFDLDLEKSRRCRENTLDIQQLLGGDRLQTVNNLVKHRKHMLCSPDIVAYHPIAEKWVFIEVKVDADPIEPDQIRTLAAIRDTVIGCFASIVRLRGSEKEVIDIPELLDVGK